MAVSHSSTGWLKAEDAPEHARQPAMRERAFFLLGTALVVIAAVVALWWWQLGSRYISTDDAYVNVSTAQVTPLTTGRVLDVRVQVAQAVYKDDVVLVIDPTDAQLAVFHAEGAYGATVRKAETYFAQVSARRADYERARLDFERPVGMKGTGAISSEELSGYEAAYEASAAALQAAEALTQGTDVENLPQRNNQLAGLSSVASGKPAESSPALLSCCFPGASPASRIGAGKQKRPRRAILTL